MAWQAKAKLVARQGVQVASEQAASDSLQRRVCTGEKYQQYNSNAGNGEACSHSAPGDVQLQADDGTPRTTSLCCMAPTCRG